MKKQNYFTILLVAILTIAGLTACNDNDEEGRKITGYKEYTLTVASVKLPGVLTSSGSNVLADVYAVKNEQSTDWEAHGRIGKFEYEEGYEYQIRISETSCLDYNMGDPAWTEYELLKVISKERKVSENLPPHFIRTGILSNVVRISILNLLMPLKPTKKMRLKMTLKPMQPINSEACVVILLLQGTRKWFLLDVDMHIVNQGFLISRGKEPTEFPESYKLLPPESKVAGYGEFNFVTGDDIEDTVMQYDVFIYAQNRTPAPQNVEIWLYKDLTAYYQNKYPEANVKAVVIRYMVKNL